MEKLHKGAGIECFRLITLVATPAKEMPVKRKDLERRP